MNSQRNWNLHDKISTLNLRPEVATIVESSRPLKDKSLRRISNNIDTLSEHVEDVKERSKIMPEPFWFACGLEFTATLCDDWSAAIVIGAAHNMYRGKYTSQDAYATLCLAAGSCLRAPFTEGVRVALSIITKAGFRPPRHDESPLLNIPVSEPSAYWVDLASTYGALKGAVKGAGIVECLATGLGCMILEGRTNNEAAQTLFTSTYRWRSSSPIPQLLRGEKC